MKITGTTNTFKPMNEDAYGITTYGAFVIDGASALVKNNYTPLNNDVVWYVSWWRSYLIAHLDNLELSLEEILMIGMERVNEEYNEFVAIDQLSNLERVSASIAIVRNSGQQIEAYTLGDCEIRVSLLSGELIHLCDDKIAVLDNQVKELMASNPNRMNEVVFKEFTQEELDLLQVNRQKMNSLEGYFILSHDLQALKHGNYQEFTLKEVANIIIQSDGLVVLDEFYSMQVLVEKMKNGLEAVIEELREKEVKDAQMQQVVRLKRHDDATIVLIEY